MKALTSLLATSAALLVLGAGAKEAHAGGDLQGALGVGVGVSGGNDWSGDGVIPYGALRLAYRFENGFGIVVSGREGHAKVDDRLLTAIGLGVAYHLRLGETRPWAQVTWLHQHEESVAVAREQPLGVLFGVGRGIRHRAGFGSAVGIDIPLSRKDELTFNLSPSLFFDFPFEGEAPGPSRYAGALIALSLDYSL